MSAMTSVVLAVCVFACLALKGTNALNDDHREIIQTRIIDLARECFLEHKISAADIISLRDFKLPQNSDVSCFLSCLFKKLMVIDDNGIVTPDAAKEAASTVVSDEKVLNGVYDLASSCSSVPVTGGSKCDGANNLYMCMIENREKFDFTIKFKQY